MDVTVRGAEQLEAVARSLKAAGDGELRKELLRGLRNAAKPTIADVRRSALEHLPRKGGLAATVAKSKFSVRNRLSGKTVGMRLEGKNEHDVEAIDRGVLRHPVYGRKTWVQQAVQPGWFSRPVEENVDTIRNEVQKVLADVAAKIERAV